MEMIAILTLCANLEQRVRGCLTALELKSFCRAALRFRLRFSQTSSHRVASALSAPLDGRDEIRALLDVHFECLSATHTSLKRSLTAPQNEIAVVGVKLTALRFR